MDWRHYKSRCDSPEVWSRWMLEQTLELLDGTSSASAMLRRALADAPLSKPPGHKGGEATDMFTLWMDAAQTGTVVDAVHRAVEQGLETSGTRGRGLGGFLEAWNEYQQFVAARDGLVGVVDPPPSPPTNDGAHGDVDCSPKS